ncbi:MAG: hypothetical protein RBT74_16035 [Tenuifilaceae bacterium]|nr:hypothetical protein [Tenuifilaceae bacterium]
MKKSFLILLASCFILLNTQLSLGQEDSKSKRNVVFYTFFVNFVPDGLNIPLIGFVNNAMGNHKGAQVGFINTNLKSFEGIQVGFVNTVLGKTDGGQVGFINTNFKNLEGIQVGFVNTVLESSKGAQVGFVNTSLSSIKGIQVGFVNVTSAVVNSPQIGFVNTASRLNGFQLGFVNFVDSLEGGIPLGFVSIVRKGGYRAIELFASEMHPINLSFKIGVKPLYTFISASYSGNGERLFEYGFGVGSIINIKNKLFFNPELKSVTSPKEFNTHYYSFTPKIGYEFTDNIYIAGGPSILWNYNEELHPMANPLFSIVNHTIGLNHRLIVGARLAVGVNF